MRAQLRNAARPGGGLRAGRTLPLAIALTVLVIAAAGTGGTAHFTGARWFPHITWSSAPATTTSVPHKTSNLVAPKGPRVKRSSWAPPWWLFIALAAAFVILVGALLWRWLRARPAGRDATAGRVPAVQTAPLAPPESQPEPEALLTGIELALQALDEQREPSDAVVRAWLGLQETAQESGIVRYASETPTEFASRVLSGVFTDARPLHTLLRLYLRARFGDHPVTADDVAAVRYALHQLLASWQAADGPTGAEVR